MDSDKTLKKVFQMAVNASNGIRDIVEFSQFDRFDDLSALEIDYNDPEQILLWYELRSVLEQFQNSLDTIEYLEMPIAWTDTLHKNANGRYETEKQEYRSGYQIEAYIYDDYNERYAWIISRVEHDGNDYYIVNYKDVPMEGLKVRKRARND